MEDAGHTDLPAPENCESNSEEYDVTGGTAGEDPSYYRMGLFYATGK